jgi:hypothetical protein
MRTTVMRKQDQPDNLTELIIDRFLDGQIFISGRPNDDEAEFEVFPRRLARDLRRYDAKRRQLVIRGIDLGFTEAGTVYLVPGDDRTWYDVKIKETYAPAERATARDEPWHFLAETDRKKIEKLRQIARIYSRPIIDAADRGDGDKAVTIFWLYKNAVDFDADGRLVFPHGVLSKLGWTLTSGDNDPAAKTRKVSRFLEKLATDLDQSSDRLKLLYEQVVNEISWAK